MENGLDIMTFLNKANKHPVVDVRTPAEYTQGHIPTAYNIPLFLDDERKKIGTTYKHSGQEEAILMGLDYAGSRMKEMAARACEIAAEKQLLVHCWRGGMRSASMAWLFQTVGLESFLLDGGYKSFRRHVLSFFENDFPFIVIGGFTGAGKSEVLRALKKDGEQVLDLEKLAHHKGSAFGGIGEPPQLTNEQFENDIFWDLNRLDKNRIIWIEDESQTIGKNTLPGGIYKNIRSAPLIFLDVPLPDRIERLVNEYSGFAKESLIESVQKIRSRLGDQNARSAIEGIREENYHKTAGVVLHYYDKTYRYGLGKRDQSRVFHLPVKKDTSATEKGEQILLFVKRTGLTASKIINS
jgi:tRNA 2-selenouridine synthase